MQSESQTAAHFWIGTSRFFDTTLFLLRDKRAGEGETVLTVLDPDGQEINRLSVEASAEEPTIFEVDQFLGGCKIESGIRHAHVVVTAPPGVRALSRVHSKDGA